MHNLTAQVFNIFLMNVHTGLNVKKKLTIVITEASYDKKKQKRNRMELLIAFCTTANVDVCANLQAWDPSIQWRKHYLFLIAIFSCYLAS